MWIESTIALKFLRQGFTQTILILVGIAVGVSVIVFITTLVMGLQANIVDRTLGTQSHIRVQPFDEVNVIQPAPEGVVQLILEDKRPQRLRSINNWQEVMLALESLEDVKAVSPVITGPAFARRGDVLKSVSLLGIDPVRYEKIIPVEKDIIRGEFRVGPGDAVIGKILADDLGLRVGNKMRLEAGQGRSAVVTLVGIFEMGVRELDSRYVYLDIKQTQSLLGLFGAITLLDVTVQNLFKAEPTAKRIAQLTGLKSESWMQTNAQLMNALSSQSLSTNIINFFVALSVAFGIASVLAISVTQRTREIGILRAMGIRRNQMLRVFLFQGGLLGLTGASIGVLLGIVMVWAFNTFGPRLFYIPLSTALIPVVMFASTLTGVLAAMVPAWRASNLNPVVAIRYV
ncbi:ABC transporter permease [Zwartia vadi]|uniref:ABC transporter permease n=1 Tax=Zwartia vadi TaxID=3058168 RepID=UPI0025B47BE4|nr:ABC transporter permease [Zwartia vadi]MDN3986301.1 ABC transporter permease [Zwartia vadi]